MTNAELDEMLRRWARAFGVRPPPEWDEDASDDLAGSTHVLLRAVRVGTRSRKRRRRLRTYTTKDGSVGVEPAPESFCYGKESQGGARPMHIDPVAEAVDVALLELYRVDPMQSVVLKIEYGTGRRRRKERVHDAGEKLGERITAHRYRHELELGRAWLLGRFSSARQAA